MAEKEVELLRVKQERIEKLNVLTVLQEEQNMLQEALRHQSKVQSLWSTEGSADYGMDLWKLKEISKQQQEQLKVTSIATWDHSIH